MSKEQTRALATALYGTGGDNGNDNDDEGPEDDEQNDRDDDTSATKK